VIVRGVTRASPWRRSIVATAVSGRLASQTFPLAVACAGGATPTSGSMRIRCPGPSALATNSTCWPSTTASCTSSSVSSARACSTGAQMPEIPTRWA
jgi:hypothetical protein